MLLLSKVTLKSSCPKTGPEVGSFSAAACLWFSLTLTLKGFSPNAFLMLKRNAEFEDIALVPSGPKGRIKVIISLISVISSVTLLSVSRTILMMLVEEKLVLDLLRIP